jgi:tetratricopeptide (TPR) repeat protein
MKRTLAAASLVALLALLVFAPLWRAEFITFDDIDYLTRNAAVQRGLTLDGVRWAATTFRSSNWHPLTWISHMAVAEAFGLDPAWHHLASVVLHALVVLAWALFLASATGELALSAAAAGLFAVHPLRVEPVAWVSERKEVLAAFFCMLTLLAWVRHLRRPSPGRYALVTACFALALLSKPMAVTLPFWLVLLDRWPLGRFGRLESGGGVARSLAEKTPLLALSAAASVVTVLAQSSHGALAPTAELPVGVRLANAVAAVGAYLRQTAWPAGLDIIYRHRGMPDVPALVLAAAVTAAVTAWAIRRRRSHPFLLVGWLWFLGTLVPVLGLVQVGNQSHADRYTYLPHLGLLAAGAWGAWAWAGGMAARRRIVAVAAALLTAGWIVASVAQESHWMSSRRLFSRSVALDPGNHLSAANLGTALWLAGEYDAAERIFTGLVAADPVNTEGHYFLGLLAAERGDYPAALAEYRRAVEVDPSNQFAWNNMGTVLLRLERREEALEAFRESVRLRPEPHENWAGYLNLGAVLVESGDTAGGRRVLSELVAADPGQAEAWYWLGETSLRGGEWEVAAAEFGRAVAGKRAYAPAHFGLGLSLERLNRLGEAEAAYTEALRLDPGMASAWHRRGLLRVSQGRTREGDEDFRRLAGLLPGNADLRVELGNIMASAGDADAARRYYAEALRIAPGHPRALIGRSALE